MKTTNIKWICSVGVVCIFLPIPFCITSVMSIFNFANWSMWGSWTSGVASCMAAILMWIIFKKQDNKISRNQFSKIRSDKFYKPSKTTAIAFALALELPLSEMQDMLRKAGFTLSHSSKFDIIVEFFVQQGNYNVFEINAALFSFDQRLIGV